MQKYSPIDNSTPNMQEDSQNGSFYWCSDADARIERLETALKSCMFALTKQREAVNEWTLTVDHAIKEAKQALALSPTG